MGVSTCRRGGGERREVLWGGRKAIRTVSTCRRRGGGGEGGYYIELYPLVEGEEGRGGRLLHRTVSTYMDLLECVYNIIYSLL